MNVEQSQPTSPTNRKAGRLRLRIRAQAITHIGTLRVVLCDLSEGGAKVFTNADLPCSRDLVLRWAGHEAFGTVMWEREGFRGVQFDNPISLPVLLDTRHMQDTEGMDREAVIDWIAERGWAFGKALS